MDAAAIGAAVRTIDIAAYQLTDVAVIDALAAAGRRGVRVRVYLDRSTETPQGYVAQARAALAATPITDAERHRFAELVATQPREIGAD